jgi:outer membrane receptor protein involved in Fe transport
VKNLITTLGANYVLGQCFNNNLFCANVHRAPGGSLFTGTGFVDNPTLNIGSEKTRGVDVTALYRMDIGSSTLSFDLVGSYLDKFTVNPGAPGSAAYECAGEFGQTCGTPLPKWRHKLRVNYDMKNGLGFSAAWRFFSSVTNDQIAGGSALECTGVNGAGACVNGSSQHDSNATYINHAVAHIPSVSYFDLSMTARIADHYTFRLGVQNLLDKQPPVLDTNYTNNGSNVYAQVYDALGRYMYAAIQLNF